MSVIKLEWREALKNKIINPGKSIDGNPFSHVMHDDFLPEELLVKIENEFPIYSWDGWFVYNNQLENKKALNDWNKFPKYTYSLFCYLNSRDFISCIEQKFQCELFDDPGLHGGGWHAHSTGGALNPHLDYSIHPKLGLQRKLNLIIYLCRDWQESWGGHFGLWQTDPTTKSASNLYKEYPVGMNKAMIFDTTQSSWHGLSRKVSCPINEIRRSLAVYYLCKPPEGVDKRGRALFAQTPDQIGDKEIDLLIKLRAGLTTAEDVYRCLEK